MRAMTKPQSNDSQPKVTIKAGLYSYGDKELSEVDSATTDEDTPVTIDVLANNNDVDVYTLTLTPDNIDYHIKNLPFSDLMLFLPSLFFLSITPLACSI